MSISVVSRGLNSFDIFVTGNDPGNPGVIFHKSYDQARTPHWAPSQSGPYTNLGGSTIFDESLSAVAWGPGRSRIDVFGVQLVGAGNYARALLHTFTLDGSNFSPVESLGESNFQSPSPVSWGPARLDLFGAQFAGVSLHKWLDALDVSNNLWSNAETLGGIISQPRAVSWGSFRLDIFALGADRQMYHKWYGGTEWGPSYVDWQGLGGVLTSAPIPVSWASDRLDIFARGTDGALYHKWWNARDWGPSLTGWEGLGGGIAEGTEPSAVSRSPGFLDVFVTTKQGGPMYHNWWDGRSWQSEGLGGSLKGSPAAVCWGPKRIDVFAQFTDNQVHHNWADYPTDRAQWGNWEPLGIPAG